MIFPAITIRQPWAGLVAAGFKTVENRTIRPPASVRGRRVAIHAGRMFDANWDAFYGARAIVDDEIYETLKLVPPPLADAHKAVLATARVVGYVVKPSGNAASTTMFSASHDLTDDDLLWWDRARIGWILRDTVALPEPVAARGNQGVWNWTVPEGMERTVTGE